jgi:hypothetical protein
MSALGARKVGSTAELLLEIQISRANTSLKHI